MTGRLVVGASLLAVGVLFLLGGLDVIDQPGAILGAWWPLVFVFLAVSLAIEQKRLGIGPVMFAALGLLLLTATTDLVAVDGRVLWPVALILAGAWLLLGPQGAGGRVRVEGATVEVTSIFGDRQVRGDAAPFERASLTSVLGDLDVNLAEAQPGDDMTVDISVLFGDVEVALPASWRVALSPTAVFGDVKHLPAATPPPADAPVVRVRGFTVFGDVVVRQ